MILWKNEASCASLTPWMRNIKERFGKDITAKSLFDGVGGLFLICHCHGKPFLFVGVGVKNDAVCIVQYIAHIALQAVACQFDQCFLHGPILSEA